MENAEVSKIIYEAAEFTQRMGFAVEAAALRRFSEQFKREKPTLKTLRGPVLDAKDAASRRIREEVLYNETRDIHPNKQAEYEEFNRIWLAFGNVIYPQKRVPAKIKGLVAGNDDETSVLGDLATAREIAKHSLKVTTQFAEAIIKQDIESAYALCADELRSRMSIKQFVRRLQDADEEFNGRPIKYIPEQIFWIWADNTARNESNKDGEWPKETPKLNKRAIVGGWFTDKKTSTEEFGRKISFWVTEEGEGYRIAKFQQHEP